MTGAPSEKVAVARVAPHNVYSSDSHKDTYDCFPFS